MMRGSNFRSMFISAVLSVRPSAKFSVAGDLSLCSGPEYCHPGSFSYQMALATQSYSRSRLHIATLFLEQLSSPDRSALQDVHAAKM